MLRHDSCRFILSFICHNHHGKKTIIFCVSINNKNRNRPGIDAKQVKIASFFIKTGFSFAQKGLDNRLRPGCKHHGDPSGGEVQIRVCARPFRRCVDVYPPCWGCFYVSFLHFVRQKRPFYYRKRPRFVDGHLSAVSAYGFAKMEFAGRSQIFGFLIITMTLPGSVTQSSSRVWMNTLNLSGTAWPLILPALLGGIGQVFFLKQYIAGIPDDLIGAAKIDGMGQIKIFLTLIIPLTLPALLVRVILGFIGSYNDYMGPLIYVLQHDTKWTIQLALKNISDRSPYNNIKMAACVVSMFCPNPQYPLQ